MIELRSKKDCCGCEACVQSCFHHAISFKEDKEGFLYPVVDKKLCVNCGLCDTVCPMKKQNESNTPLKIYAAYNIDEEIRKKSSSGGLFSALASYVLKQGGVVVGAAFDENWNVHHLMIDDENELDKLRRSKYVQSRIGNIYKQTEFQLKKGKNVLFAGTSCQIAGLKAYLKRDYSNLFALEVVCHGVPNSKIWQQYLNELKKEYAQKVGAGKEDDILIKDVNFRNKSVEGWRRFRISVEMQYSHQTKVLYTPIREDRYMLPFLYDLDIRPSCAVCRFKEGRSGSDIALADFWGIEFSCNEKEYTGEKGTSLVLAYTEKGKQLIDSLEIEKIEKSWNEAVPYNISLVRSRYQPWERSVFFSNVCALGLYKAYLKAINRYIHFKTIQRVCVRIKNKFRRWQKLEW